MRNLGRFAFSAAALVVILLLRTSVTGEPIEVALDADKFGKLDQKLTKCGDIGCGPTAAVNSFTYLQTAFPSVYKTPLVPAGQEVMVADALADLMGCCGAGTSIENFIRGKKSYVESKDPGATKYGAELSGKWTGTDRPTSSMRTPPPRICSRSSNASSGPQRMLRSPLQTRGLVTSSR